MKNKIYILLYGLAVMLLASCTDDRLWDPDEFVGEGEATVEGSVTFNNYVSALDGASRATGESIDGIKTLSLFFYGKSGDLVMKKSYTVGNGAGELTPTVNTDKPASSQGVSEPVSTTKLNFSFPIDYGYYKIYAVANADVSEEEASTESKLQAVAFEWQTDVTKNNQMFGWFTTEKPTAVSALTFDENGRINAPSILVSKPTMALNAWLVRLASKVTVAYDASRLKENVYIYLKSVQIKDIPKECALGISNVPDNKDELEDGEIIYYYDTEQYPGGPTTSDFNIEKYKAVLTAGKKFYGSNHAHDADSTLFFFENNQGIGKNKGQDVIVNGSADLSTGNYGNGGPDGEIDFPDGNNSAPNTGYKDEKRYGTYIEVKAYYVSVDNGEHSGQGNITYRFMLGKNTTTDYNATRNYHYKLTLQFNGYANDVDWHIEYEQEKRQIEAPNPYYISYLYNHSMMLPLSISTGSSTIKELRAKIVSNGWAPIGAENPYSGAINSTTAPSLYDKYYLYYSGADDPARYPWNGFLSLRATEETNITVPGMTNWTITSNQSYYNTSKRGEVTYKGDELKLSENSVRDALAEGKLHVAMTKDNDGNNVYTVNMPLWTRAKTLISQTAYTGNNPYVAYRREAKVQIEAELEDGTVLKSGMSTNPDEAGQSDIAIQQVRRVVNPKGIWRRGDNNKSFDVDMMILPNEESTKFESLTSTGPWRAYVFRDTKRGGSKNNATGWDDRNGTIHLESIGRTTTGTITVTDKNGDTREYQTIEGGTGSSMKFRVVFNGTTSDDNPNHAVIRVEYQNYTCYHLIFVRQGYGPDAIVEGGKEWFAMNNRTRGELAESPLEEGSMFKFGKWYVPIDASNNVNGKSPWISVVPDDFKKNAAQSSKLNIYGADDCAWTAWNGDDVRNSANTFADATDVGRHVANYEDYMEFKQTGIEQGFGVLYGDDSDKCLTDINDVYGYLAPFDKKATYNKNRGMRGCFVYNYNTGKNLFFPIGASGYGHRKNSLKVGNTTYRGVLRYSCNARWGYFDAVANDKGQGYTEGVKGAPLFFDIFRRPGALYWFQKIAPNGNDAAWDINYFSFDFGPIGHDNLGNGQDAFYVRCVKN